MKRHGFKGQGASHGAQAVHRSSGLHRRLRHSGAGVQGTRMAGRMVGPGDHAEPLCTWSMPRTACLLDQGAVPGPYQWTRRGPQRDKRGENNGY